MKRVAGAMTTAGLCALLFTGCQGAQEHSIVKAKEAGATVQYETSEAAEHFLREELGAPTVYKNHRVYQDGVLVIDTDAKVEVPEVTGINTYTVSNRAVEQELIDAFTNAFFAGEKIYNGSYYLQPTKKQRKEQLEAMKRKREEGDLDPYGFGKDENGDWNYDLNEAIQEYEESMEYFPDEVTKVEVKPAFGMAYREFTGAGKWVDRVDPNSFYGVVETKHGNYIYALEKYDRDIKLHFYKQWNELPIGVGTGWVDGADLMDGTESGINTMTEEQLKEKMDLSYEEAERLALEKMEQLGVGLELYDWDYTVRYQGEEGLTENNIQEGGYKFTFARTVDGVPVTQTDQYEGAVEPASMIIEPWGHERCQMIIGPKGVEEVALYNVSEVGAVQYEQVKLLDFDSITDIYQRMLAANYSELPEYEKSRTIHIRKITLGYARIVDPMERESIGTLVPVWDFFGGSDVEGEEVTSRDCGEHSDHSYMTINAVDGTVINRSLGY